MEDGVREYLGRMKNQNWSKKAMDREAWKRTVQQATTQSFSANRRRRPHYTVNILIHEDPAVFRWDAAYTINPIPMFRVNLVPPSSWLDMPFKNSKMALLCLKTSASDYTLTQRRVAEEQNTHLHLCENFTTRTITYIDTCVFLNWKVDRSGSTVNW